MTTEQASGRQPAHLRGQMQGDSPPLASKSGPWMHSKDMRATLCRRRLTHPMHPNHFFRQPRPSASQGAPSLQACRRAHRHGACGVRSGGPVIKGESTSTTAKRAHGLQPAEPVAGQPEPRLRWRQWQWQQWQQLPGERGRARAALGRPGAAGALHGVHQPLRRGQQAGASMRACVRGRVAV